MIFGSVCSGIEAASVAWYPLGWKCAFVAEIDKFPAAVLAHHYPGVPNYGDMTKFKEWPDAAIDVLVGGTPCQSFSVAGLRKGLDDPRGNLTLTYLAIAAKYRPTWVVWENVPGVLSDATGAFGAFLGGLAELGYGFAYRVLDAQFFGVPQRRRRVFVVANLGDWRRAAAVLFERHSLQGNPAPRREARERLAPSLAGGTGGGSGHQYRQKGNEDCVVACPTHDGVVGTLDTECGFQSQNHQTIVNGHVLPVMGTLTARMFNALGARDVEEGALIPTTGGGFDVAHSLRADGFDASEDGTGRGTPLVPVAFDTTQITSKANYSNPKAGDPCHPLAAGAHPPAIAFSSKDSGADAGEVAPTLRSMTHDGSHANGVGAVAVLEVAGTMMSYSKSGGDSNRVDNAAAGYMQPHGTQVRRLTPCECERLQGFPDDYTLIPYRNKPAADGPRYKALGNSMAVPVMRWIGERIQMVKDLEIEEAA